MRIKIKQNEIDTLGNYIKEKSGIVLDSKKAYLFESRLSPLLTEHNCENYLQFFDLVKRDISGKLTTRLVDAVCTNETSFFRDKSPFDLLVHKLIPDFYERTPFQTIKILSAACSTGQEVYSIIMSLIDGGIVPPKFRMKFTAIDISDTAIAKASRGEYSKFELARGMNKDKLIKFFNANNDNWRIKDEVRALVAYKKINLLKASEMMSLGKFDIILCRNVAIYFSNDDKKSLFNQLSTMLNPNGALIIGSTESLLGVTDIYNRLSFHNSIYYQNKQPLY